jgi:hypothetical protein
LDICGGLIDGEFPYHYPPPVFPVQLQGLQHLLLHSVAVAAVILRNQQQDRYLTLPGLPAQLLYIIERNQFAHIGEAERAAQAVEDDNPGELL